MTNDELKGINVPRVREIQTRYLVEWIEGKFKQVTDIQLAIALMEHQYQKLGSGRSLSDKGRTLMNQLAKGRSDLKDQLQMAEVAVAQLKGLDPSLAHWTLDNDEWGLGEEKKSPIVV